MQYKQRRKIANKTNAKIRKAIKKITGKKLSKKYEIDDIVPIKKGGSPISLGNKRIVLKKVNRKKGAK